MGGFFEFIADNFIIVIIIIGAIVSFMRNRSSIPYDEDPGEGQSNESELERPTIPRNNPGTAGQTSPAQKQMQEQKAENIEEQQQEQMDRLARRMGAAPSTASEEMEDEHKANLDADLRSGKSRTSYQQKEFKKEIQNRLNKKGLVDSIVMAEVLGPPRAKKPFNNITMSHRK